MPRFLIFIAGLLFAGATVAEERPNVVLIFLDDAGWADFHPFGDPSYETPHVQRLADQGGRYNSFFVPQAICSASRASLMTGCYPGRTKMFGAHAPRERGLDPKWMTMGQVFQQAGYQTGWFGKWHLGDTYPDRPMDRGFDKSIWHKGWGLQSEIEFDNDYYETRYIDSLNVKQSTKYCSNLWFDEAMDWMGEMNDKDKPFLTYIALNAPHGPFHSTMQDYKKYEDQVEDESVASFLGMITNIDRNFKRLNAWLDTNNLTRNTKEAEW
jgi:arylsulfatase A-like enzyme